MGNQIAIGNREPLHVLRDALEKKKLQIQGLILSWTTGNTPHYPWRQCGKTPYEVLIGEFWLRQTPTDAVRVYHSFLRNFSSIQVLAEASEDELIKVLSSFGLQEHARHIKTLANSLMKEGKGNLPGDSEVLIKLCGLEHHNIRAVLCFGNGLPVAIIDSNVTRMLSRIFNNTLPPCPTWGLLEAVGESLLSSRDPQRYNEGILELAEMICRHDNPHCTECPTEEICDYAKGLSHK